MAFLRLSRAARAVLGLGLISVLAGGCGQSSPSASDTTTVRTVAATSSPAPQQQSDTPSPQPRSSERSPRSAARTSGTAQDDASTRQLRPPPIELIPPIMDLGTLRPGQRATGTVQIRNTSSLPLRIVHSRASCTCTSVDLSNTIIPPGESVPLVAEFKSSTMGNRRSAVRVAFEGYDMIEVPIVAVVSLPVQAEPSYINALEDEMGRPILNGEFVVRSIDQRPFHILSVNGGEAPYVTVEPSGGEPQNVYRLRWDFSGFNPQTCRNASGKPMPSFIAIETDHPDCPLLDVEVRHSCVRRQRPAATDTWLLQDKRILVGLMKEGEPIECEVDAKWIARRDRVNPPNAIATISNAFTAEFISAEPIEDGTRVKFRVMVKPGYKGLVYDTVYLQSARQNVPLLIVGTAR